MLFPWVARKFTVARFYLADMPSFLGCLLDPKLSFCFGKYVVAGPNEIHPFFFVSDRIELSSITLRGLPLEESSQYRRVLTVLAHYPNKPRETQLQGRDTDRVFSLVEARMMGNDDFVVLLERQGKNLFAMVDGATRASVLAATGATTVRARITLRGESHFA
jgi:hypothetical protein